MQFFQDLGALVERRWRDENYNEEVFPALAEQVLVEGGPYGVIDPWDVIKWLTAATELPEQRDIPAMFGNPPITLYDGARFYIDIYYWVDGTTSIHQHAFCGAFQVWLGGSIHCKYDFTERRKVSAHFSVGDMQLRSVDLLTGGDVRQIRAGKEFIHSLFHLDRPSATIVIRTRQSQIGLPQYNYLKPSFAVDPFFTEAAMVKKVQAAGLLFNVKHPETDSLISDMLSFSDFQTAFSILDLASGTLSNNRLERAFGLSTGNQRFDSLLDVARKRHGDLVDLILPIFEEVQRQQNLIHRRGQITSNEHRFLLALLLNVPDRVKLLELVKQRVPDRNPIETVMEWIEELADTKAVGSNEANVLGIEGVDEDYLLVLQRMLEGASLADLREAFEEEFSADNLEDLGEKPKELYEAIRNSALFKAIFLDSEKPPSADR